MCFLEHMALNFNVTLTSLLQILYYGNVGLFQMLSSKAGEVYWKIAFAKTIIVA